MLRWDQTEPRRSKLISRHSEVSCWWPWWSSQSIGFWMGIRSSLPCRMDDSLLSNFSRKIIKFPIGKSVHEGNTLEYLTGLWFQTCSINQNLELVLSHLSVRPSAMSSEFHTSFFCHVHEHQLLICKQERFELSNNAHGYQLHYGGSQPWNQACLISTPNSF